MTSAVDIGDFSVTNISDIEQQLVILFQSNETNNEGTVFFSTYFSHVRLAVECVIAVIAATCNGVALGLSRRHRYHHHAYRALFWNMSIANALSAIMSCLCNNSMLILKVWPIWKPHGLCNQLAMLAAINLSTMVFALVAGFSLFGFAFVHYLLLCQPLHSDRLLHPTNVRAVLIGCWLSCCTLGISLSSLGIKISVSDNCNFEQVETYNLLGTDIFLGLVSLCYIAVFGFSIRLYIEIRGLRQNLGRFVWVDDLQFERQALRTLMLLLAVTTVFWVPYSLLYVLTINTNWWSIMLHPAVMYGMNMMPYLKYSCDPLIYGKRMLGLQHEITRVAKLTRCVCRKNNENQARRNTTTRVYRFNRPLAKV